MSERYTNIGNHPASYTHFRDNDKTMGAQQVIDALNAGDVAQKELAACKEMLDLVADAPLKLDICKQSLAVAKERLAAKDAEIARLKAELESTEASHEDEEAAHQEMLAMLKAKDDEIARLRGLADEWRGYTERAQQMAKEVIDRGELAAKDAEITRLTKPLCPVCNKPLPEIPPRWFDGVNLCSAECCSVLVQQAIDEHAKQKAEPPKPLLTEEDETRIASMARNEWKEGPIGPYLVSLARAVLDQWDPKAANEPPILGNPPELKVARAEYTSPVLFEGETNANATDNLY